MNKIILWFYFLLLPILINQSCDESKPHEDAFEITENDILKNRNWTSKDITVWGIRLGMGRGEVEKILNSKRKYLRYGINKIHQTKDYRLFVYKKNGFYQEDEIMSLIWADGSRYLNEIVFHNDFVGNLVGESENLLQENIDNFHIESLQKYLGLPNKEENTAYLSSYQSTTYYYDSIGLEIHFQELKENKSLNFSLFKK